MTLRAASDHGEKYAGVAFAAAAAPWQMLDELVRLKVF
jgi:hypothetical protein